MAEKKTPAKGKDLAAFRAAHDKSFIVPERIRKGLAELGESWEAEVDFIRRCQCSTVDFAAYRDKFLDHAVTVQGGSGNSPKRVWAGTKAYAAKLRECVA